MTAEWNVPDGVGNSTTTTIWDSLVVPSSTDLVTSNGTMIDTVPIVSSWDITNNNNNTSTTIHPIGGPDKQINPVVVVWSSLLILMLCMCMRPNIPDPIHRTAFHRRQRQQRRDERKKDPERRIRVVESSLITKRVVACDDNHILRLGDVSGSIGSIDDTFSINSLEDENTSACVICLEPFRKNDHVTWSKNMECLHVFHQECLEGWLSNPKHDDCPSCRCQIIHDDGDDKDSINGDDDDDGNNDEQDVEQSLAFVIMNGLISPLRRARDSIVGTSINMGGDSFPLRRVLSSDAERPPSKLGVVFRRVSSGIYSHFSATFDSQDGGDEPKLTDVSALRRTRSEGLPNTPKQGNSYQQLERSNSTIDYISPNYVSPRIQLDLDLGDDSDDDVDHAAISRPGLMRLGFRPSSGIYSKVAVGTAESFQELSDDEETLHPREIWDDEDNEEDLETGGGMDWSRATQ